MNEKPTELISDADLIDELARRFEHMVFAGIKPGCSDGNRYTYAVGGEQRTVASLAHWATMKTLEESVGEEDDEEKSPE